MAPGPAVNDWETVTDWETVPDAGPQQPGPQPARVYGPQRPPATLGEQVMAGFERGSANAYRLGANIFDLGGMLSEKVADILGTPRGVTFGDRGMTFGDIGHYLREGAKHLREGERRDLEHAAQLEGGRQDFPAQVARGVTQGLVDLPFYAGAGGALRGAGIPKFAAGVGSIAGLDAIRESDRGWQEALKAAAHGAATGTVLEVMGPASRPIRMSGAAAWAYATARMAGADNTTALANATTMAGLTGMHGGGLSAKDLAGKLAGKLALKSQLNPVEQAAIEMLRSRGVHVDVPTGLGNKFVSGLGKIVQNTPLGASPAWKSLKETESGLQRVAEELKQEAHPETATMESAGRDISGALRERAGEVSSEMAGRQFPQPVTAEAAGTHLREDLLGQIEGLADQSGVEYQAAWEHAGNPQFTEEVPVRMRAEVGEDGRPTGRMEAVHEPVNMPVDVRGLKAMAQPLFDKLQWRPAGERAQNAAYAVLEKLLKGPDFISAIEAEEGLKGLKELARTENKSGQRDVAQGAAANLIGALQEGIDTAVAKTGDRAIRGLQQGRALWAEKSRIQDIFEQVPEEPVQAMERLVWGRDTGIDFLRQVAQEAPEQPARIGRAVLDRLFAEPGTASTRWKQLGPETKKILFRDPEFIRDLDQTFSKEGVISTAETMPKEPEKAAERLLWARDSGIDYLRKVDAETPEQTPKLARAVLEKLFTRATREGGFRRTQGLLAEFQQLGPETLKILFKDPGLRSDVEKFLHGADLTTRNPNPSGTALVSQTSGLLYWMLHEPVTGAGYVLGSGAISKLLYSKMGARLLARSTNPASPAEASRIASDIVGLVGTGGGGAMPIPGGPSRVQEFLANLGTKAGRATREFWQSEEGTQRLPGEEGLPSEMGKLPPAEAEQAFQEAKQEAKAGEPVEEFQAAEEGRRGERRLADVSRVYAPEREIISKALEHLPEKERRRLQREIEAEVRDRKSQFPTTAGEEGDIVFSPFAVKKVKLGKNKKGERTFKVEYEGTPYSYDAPVRGRKLWERDQLTPQGERVSQRMADQLVAEVEAIRDRAEGAMEKPPEDRTLDERTAMRIAEQRHWYTRMRELLRKQFGSAGDLFADLLGATSARTPVAENFRQAVTALERFGKGHYTSTLVPDMDVSAIQPPILPQYEAHRAAGGTPKKYEGPLALRYDDKKFNANTLAVMDALIGMFRGKESSPKTQQYGGNLSGASDAATVDVWAARFLQRMRNLVYGDAPAVPQPAEGAVAGDVFKDPTGEIHNTGQFMFGQKVFEKAAQKLGMKPHELQAFVWFLEKDLWTQKGLTSAIGEGGDMAATAKGAGYGRMFAGIEPQASGEPGNAIEMMRGAESAASQDPAVKSIVNSHALGMWSAPGGDNSGKPVYSSQFEVTLPENNDASINRITAEIVKAARDNNQDDAFIARTIPDDASSHAYARPGLSVYFKKPLSEAEAWKVIEKVKTDNIGGFTLFGGPQSKPGEYVGMRFVYMPEYVMDPWAVNRTLPSTVERQVHDGKRDALRDMQKILVDLRKDGSVGHAMVEYYDVLNAAKEEYADLIEQLQSEGNAAGPEAGTSGDAGEGGLWRRHVGESVKSRALARSRGTASAPPTREGSGDAGKDQPSRKEVKTKPGTPTAGLGLPSWMGQLSPKTAEQAFQVERARRLST